MEISGMDTTSTGTSSGKQVELFALQRSYFNGPHFEPSVDCRRLFTTRREAEEVAYHSAHAFANQSIFSRNSNGPSNHLNASVKSICLPPSGNDPSGSYAFQTCGKIFWVRSLQATVVPTMGQSHAAGITYPLNLASDQQHQQQQPFRMAEVVLTEGIIGGTGNPNSQPPRGSEVSEGRVFVCCSNSSSQNNNMLSSSNANRYAVDAARQLHLSMAHNPSVKISVMTFPIGKGQQINFSTDWPASVRMELPPQQWCADPMSSLMLSNNTDSRGNAMMTDQDSKRDWNTTTACLDPRSNQNLPSKRQCQFFHRRDAPQEPTSVPCSMMTN